MKISTLLLIALFSFGIFTPSIGQVQRDSVRVTKRYDMPRAKKFRSWDIGAHIGMTYPNTDIAASDLFGSNIERELAYGLTLTKFFTHTFALQGNFITGKMSGKDLEKPDEFYYTTKIKYDISINAMIQIGNIAFLKRTPNLAVYGYVGVGQIYFDPSKSWYVQDNYILYDTTLKGVNYHNTKEIIFPFGLGVKYRISKDFSLNADYSLRITNTDKLDGYYRLLSENDDYSYFHIGLTYHIGTKEKVLEWHNPVGEMYADLAMVKDKVDLLTRDTDKDGVADIFDREPDTPEGVKVYGDGTSVDSDGDGVPDFKDAEPFTAKGVKVDAAGKEIDEDGDGIPDSRDLEPNTPKGSLVTNKGITIPVNEDGGNSALNLGAGWLPSVFFELDKSIIQKKYNETLATVGLIMMKNPSLKFEVIGNCDTRANEEYNVKLGKRRAQAVKDHLAKRYGIDPSRMTITTKGKKEPITIQDHAMNRRVDFGIVR